MARRDRRRDLPPTGHGRSPRRHPRQWKRLALLHFPTNGFLTDTIVSIAERLVRHTTSRIIVTVSLDGDEALNDEIRGIKGGYRRQVETFRRLRGVRACAPCWA